jgi:hypothetical protein
MGFGRTRALALAGLVPVLLGAAPAGHQLRYQGLCEASAAAVVDARHFVVASDDLEHLLIYARGDPAPVGRLTVPDVSDIEAAARIGDTIFWLTSHSLSKMGEDKPKRRQLFATKVVGSRLELVGTRFRDLRALLARLAHVDEKLLARRLNIEGLAAAPDGSLLIGLRRPLADGKAQVVRIADPFALVGLAPPARGAVTAPSAWLAPLALGGRGIRSIERAGEGAHRYLIAAGGPDDDGVAPKLFWWDGGQRLADGPHPDLRGMAPEALIVWGDGSGQLIGDNEDECSDKRRGEHWYPSVDFTIG